jgi:bifunctional ADP-heptose synthase (sugar kinase/adenylyltransferase)
MESKMEHVVKNIDKNDLDKIRYYLDKIKQLKILIIGDTIIDQYVFVRPKGRAIKDPILSTEYVDEESYAGGILAIANHVSSYVKGVKVITVVGDKDDKLGFINSSLDKNVVIYPFTKSDSQTTTKKRYIDGYKNNKLFKIEYINDRPISKGLTNEIIDYLNQELSRYDMVIVGDFGHGFINQEL